MGAPAINLVGRRSSALLPNSRLRDVVCPQCGLPFILRWESFGRNEDARPSERVLGHWSNRKADKPITVVVRACPSGGVYDVILTCPFCDYEEPL